MYDHYPPALIAFKIWNIQRRIASSSIGSNRTATVFSAVLESGISFNYDTHDVSRFDSSSVAAIYTAFLFVLIGTSAAIL
jgi:hypothetical protein